MARTIKMERISIFLTVGQLIRLRGVAERIGVPMAEVVRRLLDEALALDEEREHEREGVAHG